ncbi:hypothetical protein [Haloarcula amylovorans]|uniref:hypothetical protein n=1 Tax=Haloarcula amylovorans TaxID=2562280 RepID=UPI0010766C57|nr:hypothetical protein [Halomicroarcula amylolytica]
MQRGIIGVPVQSHSRFTTVEPYHSTTQEYGHTLHAAIEPTEQRDLSGDTEFVEGRALKESTDDESKWYYDADDGIQRRTVHSKVQHASKFVAVPGDSGRQGFAMVDSSDGTFAFSVLGRADHTLMDRAEIDLGDFYFDREDDFSIRTGGCSGALDKADTLMAWGSSIEDDDNVGRPLDGALRSNTIPQLAGQYASPAVDGIMRVNLAASGYVEVWEPELSTYEFLEWVRADILPYVRGADEGRNDASEQAEADPDQPGLDEFEGDEPDSCQRCGRESDTINDAGYCIVCRDKREEEAATDGGESDV